ncbi:MAG: hypothetical protein J5804_06965 [Eggerthellaceae bacterium]|nr:hypothetical protein [Eggerthellaceae bacterium]
MDAIETTQRVERLLEQCEGNMMTVFTDADTQAGAPLRDATEEELAHASRVLIFDVPLVGVASADDDLFDQLKQPEVMGPHFKHPYEWLPGAKSVVSVFFPFSEQVRKSNREGDEASLTWQYAKYFGTKVIAQVCQGLCDELEADGWQALMPSASKGFGFTMVDSVLDGEPDLQPLVSWSERHAAFACGLGTFGISKGLITQKGMAGRFGSIITDAPITITPREYEDPYEWCSHCNACIRRCPPGAIASEGHKNNKLCREWCLKVSDVNHLGDACGKCQVKVPCEFKRPKLRS